MTTASTTHYFQQATTGKLHATKSCSITSRTRYNHFEVDLTDAEAAQYEKCAKCFDVERVAPQRDSFSIIAPQFAAAFVRRAEELGVVVTSQTRTNDLDAAITLLREFPRCNVFLRSTNQTLEMLEALRAQRESV